jgi:hypothetical protein
MFSSRGAAARSVLAVTLAAATALGGVAPASAGDWDNGWNDDVNVYRERPIAIDETYGQRDIGASRHLYRDEVGRFYIRHGRKQYVQYWDDARPHRPHPQPVEQPRRKRDKTAEAAIIAGIAGLAIGAVIAGTQQQPQRVIAQPAPHPRPNTHPVPRDTFPERPRDIGGPRVISIDNAYEPWTQGWADWCRARYRSFNINTGTFTGYDGVKRFCEVK